MLTMGEREQCGNIKLQPGNTLTDTECLKNERVDLPDLPHSDFIYEELR